MGYGRTSYEDIPIVDAARRCGVVIKENTLGRTEVEAICPFCGDKPRRYHLSLNTETDQYYCFLCDARGNSVSLYARLKNVSYAEAAEDLMEYCNIIPMPRPPQRETPPERIAKPISERHDVYFEMLSHLALSDRHLNDLRERGLSDERIGMNMYRTLPKSETARRFLAGMLAGAYDLLGVPGFYTDKSGHWTIAGKGGLLIPVCDKHGYIQGLQVRLDDEDAELDARGSKRRYRWLSSRYKENGTRSGNYIHVTGDISRETAYLTEGPLKGDVASFHDNEALFICVAGINSIDGLTEIIKSLGVTEILLAADMDKVVNKQVREGFEKIAKVVSRIRGIKVRPVNWNVCFKGIDDYYLVRRKAYERGQNMSIQANNISTYLHALWKKEYPGQDAGFIDTCEWEEKIIPISELVVEPPKNHLDMKKARLYKVQVENGVVFPPVISVNKFVIDGFHRCRAYSETGKEYVHVYQNKPFELQEAA